MNVNEVMQELEALGKERTKKYISLMVRMNPCLALRRGR